jgi:hypothetical protein
MDFPPPSQDDDPIITQFKPVKGQWELNDENIKRVDWWTGETILINYCCYINTTPLAVYRYLIKTKGCNVGVQDRYKYAALQSFYATEDGGNITALKYLLSQTNVNVDINDENDSTLPHTDPAWYNITALLIGAFNLMYLLGQKMFNVNINDKSRYTLLHAACNNINALPLDVFKVLIETHGGDVNVQDKGNNTPLRFACCAFDPNKGGDIPVLTYLISQKDVNLNIKDQMGYNLLHLNCTNNFSVSVELNARYDTMLCQVVEFIVEKYTQQILDEVIS